MWYKGYINRNWHCGVHTVATSSNFSHDTSAIHLFEQLHWTPPQGCSAVGDVHLLCYCHGVVPKMRSSQCSAKFVPNLIPSLFCSRYMHSCFNITNSLVNQDIDITTKLGRECSGMMVSMILSFAFYKLIRTVRKSTGPGEEISPQIHQNPLILGSEPSE